MRAIACVGRAGRVGRASGIRVRSRLEEPHRPGRPRPPKAALQRGHPRGARQRTSCPRSRFRRYRRPARSTTRSRPTCASGVRAGSEPSLEELMDQAKNYVCKSCSTPVPMGHKFCGRCGAAIPPDILNARTQFFGQLQVPGKAKLILIRGEGVEGLSYQLNADQHIVGRNGQLVFPDDPFVSPRHANLFYRGGKPRGPRRGLVQRRVLARARQRRRRSRATSSWRASSCSGSRARPRPTTAPPPTGRTSTRRPSTRRSFASCRSSTAGARAWRSARAGRGCRSGARAAT